jgi:branched-subunit amino acid ABC-type transport system permease component
MHDYLPFVVIGLTTGAVYALASLGLVLTYRTSGVFNFAHGAVGMFATYLFYSLRQHMPTAPAVAIAVLVVAPLMGLAIDQLFRRLDGAGATASIVATLGLLVGLQGLATALYGGEARRLSPLFPIRTYRMFDLNIGIDQTVVVAVAVLAGLALIVFFRATHLGLQTRAVVDNRALSGLVGTNPSAVTRFSWMLGAAFAATSGILFAPFVGLDSIILTLLVVQAFGAAAVGGLQSFPVIAVAAFGVGVAQSVITKIVGEIGNQSLTALPSAVPFIVLFVVLLFSRQTQLNEPPVARPAGSGRRGERAARRFPARSVALILGAAAVLPPFLDSSRLLTLSVTVVMVLLFSSLSLLIGLSRQLSLCHAVFVVFGATTLAHLQSAGLPYLLALPLSGLVVVPIGAALAFPAIRLSSLYLGLATFGFGILAEGLFPTGWAFGAKGFVAIDRPEFLNGDNAFYYFALAVVAAGVVAVEVIRVTRLGRTLAALADSPRGVGSLGVSPLAARVVTFCASAFLAGVAGGLLGTLVRSVSATSFSFFQSLLWVTVLVAAGSRTVGGVALGAVLLVAVPATFTAPVVTEWQPVVFGALAIIFAQAPNGLIGSLSGVDTAALAERYRWRLGSGRGAERLDRLDRLAAVER